VITGGLRGPRQRIADARPGHGKAPLSVPGSRQAPSGPGPLEADPTIMVQAAPARVSDRTPRHAGFHVPGPTVPFSAPGAGDVPGFRLVIGADGDSRAWVRVANALLDRIASGAVRAGSRVPPVTGLGLESPAAPGAAVRAFRVLAGEGALCWVPGRGYYVRTRFTVTASGRQRRDGGLSAVLPGGGPRHA
jgi:hypothetical protein